MQRHQVFFSLLLLIGTLWSGIVQPTTVSAQSPDCYIDVYETVRNAFGAWYDKKVGIRVDPACLQDDNRVNVLDRAAGVVIYCLPDASIAIYDVDIRGDGKLVLSITANELAAVPSNPTENTLIDSEGVIRLYRLTSGELQVNAPGIYSTDPEYVFDWSGCPV